MIKYQNFEKKIEKSCKKQKMKLFLTISLIEAHKTRWKWKSILNVQLIVPLNETHKTKWRELLITNQNGCSGQKSVSFILSCCKTISPLSDVFVLYSLLSCNNIRSYKKEKDNFRYLIHLMHNDLSSLLFIVSLLCIQ